jgi:hypothetical protein
LERFTDDEIQMEGNLDDIDDEIQMEGKLDDIDGGI